jgi:hypothetical protein
MRNPSTGEKVPIPFEPRVGWDARYASDWCVTQSGIFTSAAPKYQYVTMTAYSEKVVSNLFVSPAAPARRGGGH